MTDKDSELRVLLHRRDGRRRYDEDFKRNLVKAALRPGVSVARLAQDNGVNANLLRKWINKYLVEQERCAWPAAEAATIDTTALEHVRLDERQTPGPMLAHVAQDGGFARVVCASERPVADDAAQPTLSSFALALQANLPNGVRLELGKMTLEELTTIVPMLGRLPCSGSTKD